MVCLVTAKLPGRDSEFITLLQSFHYGSARILRLIYQFLHQCSICWSRSQQFSLPVPGMKQPPPSEQIKFWFFAPFFTQQVETKQWQEKLTTSAHVPSYLAVHLIVFDQQGKEICACAFTFQPFSNLSLSSTWDHVQLEFVFKLSSSSNWVLIIYYPTYCNQNGLINNSTA